MTTSWEKRTLVLLAALAYLVVIMMYAQGVPGGASITSNTTDTGPTSTPGNRSDDGGTINTLVLDSTQQNSGWKAYIGNVTGSLTLDDSNSNTIYDWALTSISGEVYVSRDNSVGWSSISCASQSTISTEQSFIGGTAADDDSINNTYNYTQHETMQVGVNSISNGTCRTTYTHQSDSFPGSPGEGTNFTAILLEDADNSLIYASFLEQDVIGFDSSTYDFQVIVPDNETAAAVTYYFYVELGG